MSEQLLFTYEGAKPPTPLFAWQIRGYPRCGDGAPQRPARVLIRSSLGFFEIGDHAFKVFGLFHRTFFDKIGLNMFHILGQCRIWV